MSENAKPVAGADSGNGKASPEAALPEESSPMKGDLARIEKAIRLDVSSKSIGEVVALLDRRVDKLESLRALIITVSGAFGVTGAAVIAAAIWAATQLRDAANEADAAQKSFMSATDDVRSARDKTVQSIKDDINQWITKEIRPTLAGSIPIGTIVAFSGLFPDDKDQLERQGWLLCDGKSVKTGDYEVLASKLKQTGWGASTTSGEFLLPDLQGQFLRGVDSTGGVDKDRDRMGQIIGSPQSWSTGEAPNLKMTGLQTYENASSGDVVQSIQRNNINGRTYKHWCEIADVRFDGWALETRPVNRCVYWLIKAK